MADGPAPVLFELVAPPEPPAARGAGPQNLPPPVPREGGGRPAGHSHVALHLVAPQSRRLAEPFVAEVAAMDALSSALLGVAVPVGLGGEILSTLGTELPPPGVHSFLVLLHLGLGGELLATDVAAGGDAMLVAIVEVELPARLEGLVAHAAEVAVLKEYKRI